MNVKEKLAAVQSSIGEACDRTGRDQSEVNIIAVTKYVTNERTQEAVDSGIVHLGENRLEGLMEKRDAVTGNAVWHFIGSLQSRKVKDVLPHIDFLHSLDRLSLAKEIQKRATDKVNCFVQVNVAGEESKQGISPEEVQEFVESLEKYDKINVVGLMTMAPYTSDQEQLRGIFKEMKRLQLKIEQLHLPYAPCHELSMGMSNDYTIAIEEGATYVRIGTALVGE